MHDNAPSSRFDELPLCPKCDELTVCHHTPRGPFYQCLECATVYAVRPITEYRLTEVYCIPNFNPIGEKSRNSSPLQSGRTASKASVEKIDPENLPFSSPSPESAKASGSIPFQGAVVV